MNIDNLKKTSLCLAVLFLANCRLVMTAGEGGSIISTSGSYDCEDSCTFDVPEKGLIDTFTAVPDENYEFVGWEEICKKELSTTCVVNVPELFATTAFDVTMKPVFKKVTSQPDSVAGIWDYSEGMDIEYVHITTQGDTLTVTFYEYYAASNCYFVDIELEQRIEGNLYIDAYGDKIEYSRVGNQLDVYYPDDGFQVTINPASKNLSDLTPEC